MSMVSVLSCKLDHAGIPDLTDLTEVEFDLEEVGEPQIKIIVDDRDSQQRWYYPVAVLVVDARIVFVPLEREATLDTAHFSGRILEAGLRPPAANRHPDSGRREGN